MIAFAVAFVVAYLPFAVSDNGAMFGSLFTYLREWDFNGSIFNLLKLAIGFEWSRNLVAAGLVVWMIFVLTRSWGTERKMFAAFGGYLCLTTTLFPWYFVWFYPLLLRNLSRAFLLLSGTLLLSYHVHIGYYADGDWSSWPWMIAIEYIPFYVLLVVELRRQRGRLAGA